MLLGWIDRNPLRTATWCLAACLYYALSLFYALLVWSIT